MFRSTLLYLFFVSVTSSTIAQVELEVMTYNLRYATETDGENAWSKRKADVVDLLKFYAPDVFGVQEAIEEQMAYIDSAFTNYAYIGVGRDDGKRAGEYSAIFYDSTRLSCLASETFWLSETPAIPSFGWGANYRRVCTYGSFLDRISGDTVHVFNAHFDHEVELARLNSAQVILNNLTAKNLLKAQLVVMGDFNCKRGDDPMERFASKLEHSEQISFKKPYGPKSTFSGFEAILIPDNIIDHILVRNLSVSSCRRIDDRRPNGLWPSDHLPVLVELSSNK